MGIRGIPANYGGFETLAEHLAPRLAQRGHDVTVYGRHGAVTWPDSHYKGVRLVILPTIHTKHLDTPVHTVLSCAHAMTQKYDAILVCNAANAAFIWPLRLVGTRLLLNVDGIERLRKKWGKTGRAWYWLSEYLATKVPNAIVSDAAVIQTYYLEHWNAASTMIPYGADTNRPEGTQALVTYGVEPRRYMLVVARLEPENNVDLVISAFSRIRTDLRLVIIGDTPYDSEYKTSLHELAKRDPRIVMTGFLYGEACRELQANCYCYIQAADVGGTSPALLEGMALGGCVIVNGTAQNLEVVAGLGRHFEPGSENSLVECLQHVVDHVGEAESAREVMRARIDSVYSWETIALAYERLLDTSRATGPTPPTSGNPG